MTKRPTTILVVDDDAATRELFTTALRWAGFSVTSVTDGLGALQVVELSPPDLIVLDLDLPTLQGTTVYEELQSHEETRHIPVVVVTGFEWHSPLTPPPILRKPIDPDVLVVGVRKRLAGRIESA